MADPSSENTRSWIRETEKSWLPVLEKGLEACFSGVFLPSHDLHHHRRVWAFARRLLMAAPPKDPAFVEELLHAAYFHDAGMARDHGPLHGKLGMEMYLGHIPDARKESASAILIHDLKEELHYRMLGRDPEAGILDYLSVADDLDALGTIGIYRYAEIYLARDIPEDELAERILANAHIRFENLSRACSHLPVLMEGIAKEFEVLVDFYHLYPDESRELFGLIRNLGFRQEIRPEYYHLHSSSPFYKVLKHELERDH